MDRLEGPARDNITTVRELKSGTLSALSSGEERVLQLYDRLLEVEFEIALQRASRTPAPDDFGEPQERDLRASQEDLLGSSAAYLLRRDAVDSVMMVKPVLNAVHHATDASHIEHDLLPPVEDRDASSIAVSRHCSNVRAVLDQLTAVESETIRISRKNMRLASELLQLAETSDHQGLEMHTLHREEIQRLGEELKGSRQKWKVIKGAASAIIVGSGVDWASDVALRHVVLDPD